MRFFLRFLFFISLISCSNEEKELPPYEGLSNEKFIQVYIELKTMELHLQQKTSSHAVYRKWMEEASDSIFNKYQTTGKDFYGAYDYYMQEPMQLHDLFESALDTINLRKNKLQSN